MSRTENSEPVAESLRTQSIGGMLWTITRTGGMVALRFLMLIVLARLLTPEEFGLMSAASIVLGFSAIFYQLGVGPALVQRPEISPTHIRTGLTVSVGLSLVFWGAVALGAPLIARLFDLDDLVPVLQVAALVFPISGISVVATSLMQRDLRFRELAIIDVGAYAIGYGIVGVSLAAMGAGVWALVGAHLTKSAVSSIALVVKGHYGLRPGFNVGAFRELMVYGGGFTLARVFNYMAGQGDNFVAARWLGAAALGAYGRAYQLLAFPVNQLTFVIGEVLFPAMARIQESKERLSGAFRRGATFMALVFAPLGLIAAVLAPEIVAVFLGDGWSETIGPFQVLAVGMLFRAGYQISDVLVKATGAVYRRAWRQAAYAVAVVAGAWIGQHWGLVGMSFGVLAALIVNFILMSHLSITLTSLTWGQFLRAHIPALGLSLLALGSSWGMAFWLRGLEAPDIVTLVSAAVVAVGAIALVVFLRPGILGPDQSWMLSTAQETLRRLKRGKRSRDKESSSQASEKSTSEPAGDRKGTGR